MQHGINCHREESQISEPGDTGGSLSSPADRRPNHRGANVIGGFLVPRVFSSVRQGYGQFVEAILQPLTNKLTIFTSAVLRNLFI